MNEENNTFTVAASSLDYSNLTVSSDSCVIGNHEIPLEKVNGAIDKFEEETKARKKDIEDLKFFTELSKDAICDSFNYNMKMIKKEVQEIRNQLFICVSVFGSLTLFLLFGFIYRMMF
jgi:hypothetical protein